VHYIGKTTQGMTRPLQHMSDSHNKKVTIWVDELKKIGYKPKLEILSSVSDNENLDDKELFWCQRFINKGHNLLNSNLVHPLLVTDKTKELISDTLNVELNIDEIANLIKSRRKALEVTQEDFANKTGIGLKTLRKIEQFKTNIMLEPLLSVLSMFGMTLDVKKIK